MENFLLVMCAGHSTSRTSRALAVFDLALSIATVKEYQCRHHGRVRQRRVQPGDVRGPGDDARLPPQRRAAVEQRHDVFAVKALLEQTVPKDSGLLAGALHAAVALDAVPETHYCREMWKATREIGRFDSDGSEWCTAALSALVGIPLDTKLEVQLDPSPKASSPPPTTPPK